MLSSVRPSVRVSVCLADAYYSVVWVAMHNDCESDVSEGVGLPNNKVEFVLTMNPINRPIGERQLTTSAARV